MQEAFCIWIINGEEMKKNITRVFFIVLVIFTIWYLDGVLCLKSKHGINQARALYYQPRNSIDVVMMGSSHIHCDIDTGILWHDYGITAYDYSAAEQPLWCTYYYLKEFCKYQKPKVVVLDLYAPARFKEDHQYSWLHENLCGMRLSMNKLEMFLTSTESKRIEEFFPLMLAHNHDLDTLTAEDFLFPFTKKKSLETFKGFTPYLAKSPQQQPVLDNDSREELTYKNEQYLTKIIDYANENGIELYLVVTPYITNDEDELIYNRLHEIADHYGLQFNSTNYYYNEIGLDFEHDFNDASHLNYWGALKFTDYLGSDLKKRYDIPDHRSEPGYESWQKNYEEIAAYVKERMEQ